LKRGEEENHGGDFSGYKIIRWRPGKRSKREGDSL